MILLLSCRLYEHHIHHTKYLSFPQRRAKASDPVLDAISSTLAASDRVILSASTNSHNSFNEQASVNTAEWPPPAASFRTSPTHL